VLVGQHPNKQICTPEPQTAATYFRSTRLEYVWHSVSDTIVLTNKDTTRTIFWFRTRIESDYVILRNWLAASYTIFRNSQRIVTQIVCSDIPSNESLDKEIHGAISFIPTPLGRLFLHSGVSQSATIGEVRISTSSFAAQPHDCSGVVCSSHRTATNDPYTSHTSAVTQFQDGSHMSDPANQTPRCR
jgi:hypothetical protein